jgi:homocysteine S-methyltransferase
LSALSLAVLIEQQAGIETLLHYSCRDRNLLGIQSDLLGAHAMGLRNVLLITGDPGRVGDFPDATAVFDVDSIGLTNVVARLNHGYDVGGQAIGAPTAFHLGVSVNPGASDLDEELRRFDYKVERPARNSSSPGRCSTCRLRSAAQGIEQARLPIVGGVFPIRQRAQCRIHGHNEVPGVRVPEALMERIRGAPTDRPPRPPRGGHCPEIAAGLRTRVQGIQVSTASGQVESALVILDGLR